MSKRFVFVLALALGLLLLGCVPSDELPSLDELPPEPDAPLDEAPLDQPMLTETPAVSETEAVVPPTGSQVEAALVSPITGYAVQLSDGSAVEGQVVDLVLDLSVPSIRYVVVSLDAGVESAAAGSSLGVPVPWDLVSIGQALQVVTLDATLEQLEGAPVMDLSIWPAPNDSQWEAQLQTYWDMSG